MDPDKETAEANKRKNVRAMREVWARREQRHDLIDPVVLVFEAEDGLGGELAELVNYPDEEGMVIALASAEFIARFLDDYVPEVSRAIRAADRSRPLAVFASLQHWFMLVYVDDILDTR